MIADAVPAEPINLWSATQHRSNPRVAPTAWLQVPTPWFSDVISDLRTSSPTFGGNNGRSTGPDLNRRGNRRADLEDERWCAL